MVSPSTLERDTIVVGEDKFAHLLSLLSPFPISLQDDPAEACKRPKLWAGSKLSQEVVKAGPKVLEEAFQTPPSPEKSHLDAAAIAEGKRAHGTGIEAGEKETDVKDASTSEEEGGEEAVPPTVGSRRACYRGCLVIFLFRSPRRLSREERSDPLRRRQNVETP